MLNKIFKLEENKTNIKTELFAGFTTFMTMAYIIILNPNILAGTCNEPKLWNGIFLATCIASAIAMFFMAFLANKPFAIAPGMGINSFFALVTANVVALTGLSYTESFQAMLCVVVIEGLLIFLLSAFNFVDKIIDAIPMCIRMNIAPGIGLMLLNIGFGSNVGVSSKDGGLFYVMRDFFGTLTPNMLADKMGTSWIEMVLTVITIFVGFFIICILDKKGFKSAVLLGILVSCAIYWGGEALFIGNNPFETLSNASFVPPFSDMVETTLLKFNFASLLEIGWLTVIMIVITFCIIDMFGAIGTFIGTASKAGMLDENGKMPNTKEALESSAIGSVVGAFTGTAGVTTFVESAAGVEVGGRTGLTALTTGLLFLACIFISPLVSIIPAAATSAALIYVGVMMLSGLKNANFDDITEFAPVAIMLISMPISGSIGHGIGLGLISYTIISMFTGKAKKVPVLTYIISLIFLVKFFLIV